LFTRQEGTAVVNEEDIFLASIAEEPGDDACRLVYADWLDEHAQPEKAAFVRAAVRIRNDMALVSAGLTTLPPGWLGAVMGSYAVTLVRWPSHAKVPVIRAIRDATGWGLGESVYAVENLPRRIALTALKLDGHPFTFRVLMPRKNSGPDESIQRPMLCDEANALGVRLRSLGCEIVLAPFVVAGVPKRENDNELPLIVYNHAVNIHTVNV
jgi:uncharacterized protein (TIGR02996 family)